MDIIKLGGSIITRKGEECTLAKDTLLRLTSEVALSPGPLMVIHGAGSFGHTKAKKGGVQHGLADVEGKEREERILAAAEVQTDVKRLNLAVLDAMEVAGLPAFSFAPSALGRMRSKTLVHLDTRPFKEAMELGSVPLSFGDVVLDEILGFSICSGDEVIFWLAREFKPRRVVFVCDVDGVYDKDPKEHKDARSYPRLTTAEARDMKLASREGDVTGAMGGKLDWAVRIAELGIPVIFVNGAVPGRTSALLRGEDVPHTLLEAQI